MSDTQERTTRMTITVEIDGFAKSTREFKLYPGTEMVYGQGVDLAISKALGTISKVAYEIITESGDMPESLSREAAFGKAVTDAG